MQGQIFEDIKESEENLHETADEAYLCILKHYGGDGSVTERICCPEGTVTYKIKKCLQGCASIIGLVTQGWLAWRIPWSNMDITLAFICLCSHIFDYVKDLGV